jgi:hypothetical protein
MLFLNKIEENIMKKALIITSIMMCTFIFTFCVKVPTSTEIEIIPPSNLTTTFSENIVILEWRDNSNNEEGFLIERKVNWQNHEEIATVGQNVTTYVDYNVQLNRTYLYRIYGFAQNLNSDYSNKVEIMVLDTISPNKPQLVPHLGDIGDGGNSSIPGVNFYNTYNIDFENNGIDAVMAGNWIKTQWFYLEDSDIDFLKIFRFSSQEYYNAIDTLNFAQIIATVDYEDQIYYVDNTSTTNKNYFYFIEAFDNAGNSTLSDTVGYYLIDKPILTSPSDNSSTDYIYSVAFEWQQNDDEAIQHRLLIFDENRELIWQNTPLDRQDFSVQYQGPPIEPGTILIWRVDTFGIFYHTPSPIEGNNYTILSGSESVEHYIFIE